MFISSSALAEIFFYYLHCLVFDFPDLLWRAGGEILAAPDTSRVTKLFFFFFFILWETPSPLIINY